MSENFIMGKAEALGKPGVTNVTNSVTVDATQCYQCPFRSQAAAETKRKMKAILTLVSLRESINALERHFNLPSLPDEIQAFILDSKRSIVGVVGDNR